MRTHKLAVTLGITAGFLALFALLVWLTPGGDGTTTDEVLYAMISGLIPAIWLASQPGQTKRECCMIKRLFRRGGTPSGDTSA